MRRIVTLLATNATHTTDADPTADQLLVLNKDADTVSFVDAGRDALVPNRESDSASAIDTEHVRDGEWRPWEVAGIPVGIWPGGTVFAPDGDRAFVANNKTNDVSAIDVGAFEEIDRFDAGVHPDGTASLER